LNRILYYAVKTPPSPFPVPLPFPSVVFLMIVDGSFVGRRENNLFPLKSSDNLIAGGSVKEFVRDMDVMALTTNDVPQGTRRGPAKQVAQAQSPGGSRSYGFPYPGSREQRHYFLSEVELNKRPAILRLNNTNATPFTPQCLTDRRKFSSLMRLVQ
jgi:hypothetical protein